MQRTRSNASTPTLMIERRTIISERVAMVQDRHGRALATLMPIAALQRSLGIEPGDLFIARRDPAVQREHVPLSRLVHRHPGTDGAVGGG